MRLNIIIFFLLLLVVSYHPTRASHIVGADMTYKCLGNNGSSSNYEITLDLYHDCINGNPQAISDDNPAFLTIYEGNGARFNVDTSIYFSSRIPNVPTNFSNDCITNPPRTCLQKMTFKRTYNLPNNSTGYYIVYQRCCRNEQINNIRNPGNTGATYYCFIPPSNVAVCNNSAIFKNFPPQIICINNPLIYDHSATDADGDSLSYEFCETNVGGSDVDVKPFVASPPPFGLVSYMPGYTVNPMAGDPPVVVDPVTGMMTGTPNIEGRFVVSVCCNEWRNGVKINTVKREFQFVVTNCSKAVVANIPQYSEEFNTYIVECKDFTVKFDNISTGGFSYHWDFGVPELQNDVSTEFSPTYTYPDTGTFIVKLVVNRGSTCPDSIERFVKIYPQFTGNYAFAGTLCPNSLIQFSDSSKGSMHDPNKWSWNFGDGFYSKEQNPLHRYLIGGDYWVKLVSGNSKGCTDTVWRKLSVEKFVPFAGNDTIIVKGEMQLNAQGGGEYLWTPATNLSNAAIGNPIANFPQTGVYSYNVHIKSPVNQCEGDDSIRIQVVDQASLFVPSGFSPNGDGINDVLRPIGVGYARINYFRVYNRWGEQVYYTTKFKEGWDGTWKGTPADIGVYFWVLSANNRFGKEEVLRGDATLLR